MEPTLTSVTLKSTSGSFALKAAMDASPQHTAYQDSATRRSFRTLLIITQIVGIVCIILVVVWTSKYLGGIEWSNKALQFNVHPLLMVIGMIYFYGSSILVYRALREERKLRLKVMHASLHGLALLFMLIALLAVFLYKQRNGYSHLYSLHSWMGLGTAITFLLQYVMGFSVFLYPGASPHLRERVLSLHVYFGVVIFALALGSVALGINEYITQLQDRKVNPANAVGNMVGITAVLFAILVGYLVTQPRYKRLPLMEEMGLTLCSDPSPVN